ncbi:MAG: DUF4956 domain-containing protein [Nocardioidaceae bacterium]|nr:DUF4956 domain-containing protein [Nocardioidaceae bacterium]
MNTVWAVAADLIAIVVLVFGIYFRRHVRRDLVLSYVALNTGVMAVTGLLAGAGAGLGLGLGLFGILSIIRLRSDAISQEEVAYYFIALALGLVNGLHPGPAWLSAAISAGLVAVMYAADHPRFAPQVRRQSVTLDRAYPREEDLVAALEELLCGEVLHTAVRRLDMVTDVTEVDVRFRIAPLEAAPHSRLRPVAATIGAHAVADRV